MVGRPIIRSTAKVGDIEVKVCRPAFLHTLNNFIYCCIMNGVLADFVTLQDLMVGDEASKLRHMLEVNYPMDNGIVRNWDDMKHVWDYTFGETKLNVDPRNCKVSSFRVCVNLF